MVRVLSRPMFKLGGSSDGVGITSGFRRTGFQDPIFSADKQAKLEELEGQILNPEKEKYGFSELLSDAYRTARGSETFDDWWKSGADLALERTDTERAEKKAKPQKDYDILSGSKTRAGEFYKATRPLEIERMRDYFDEGMRLVGNYETWEDFSNSKDFAEWEFQMKRAYGSDFPSSFKVNQIVWDRVESENAKRVLAGLTSLKGKDLEEYKKRQITSIYKSYLPDLSFEEIIEEQNIGGNAMGGLPRNRYQTGMGPAMDQQTDLSMTENIQTPQGDMSMTENIDTTQMGQQTGMPSQTTPSDDPFVLLRARLPKEISDDVVRLIAYNPEAFADFADIETQDDVMAFNKKYGVELVVNTDELSGAIA